MNAYLYKVFGGEENFSDASQDKFLFLKRARLIDLSSYNTEHVFFNSQNRETSLIVNETDFKHFVFIVKGVVSYQCFSDRNEIHYILDELANEKLLQYWLLHIVLPIYYTMKNEYYFLHACSVRVKDSTILFMADSMGGKSTLTDHFIKNNHKLVSDDKLGVFIKDNKVMAVPSYPYHRPYRRYEDLGYKVELFEENATELSHVYVLDLDQSHDNVIVSELRGVEKFSKLIRGTEIGLPYFQKERFEFISKFTNKIPVFTITVPKDLTRLDEVYQVIVEHTNNLKRQ